MLVEYKCHWCGEHTDKLQEKEKPIFTICPHCGLPGLTKLFSIPQYILSTERIHGR